MSEQIELIERSKTPLSPNDLGVLVRLCVKKTWLIKKWGKIGDLWGLLNTQTEKKLIASLLRRFTVVSATQEKKCYSQIVKHIKDNWLGNPQRTWIVATSGDHEADGSHNIVNAIKNKFPRILRKHQFLNSYKGLDGQLQSGDIVILCDDFIGTGSTIDNRVTKIKELMLRDNIKNIDFKVVSLAAMKFSKELYLNNCTTDPFACLWLDKGISERCSLQVAIKHRETMLRIESRLSPKYYHERLKRCSLGYRQSESLYCLGDENIPNNVFPIFWWGKLRNNENFNPLFERVL